MVVAWFIVGQATALTRKALARAGGEILYAPPLVQIELASALVRLAHRRKITPAAISDILAAFEALDLVIDKTPPTARTIASTCQRCVLSAYDATYFELAKRLERLVWHSRDSDARKYSPPSCRRGHRWPLRRCGIDTAAP